MRRTGGSVFEWVSKGFGGVYAIVFGSGDEVVFGEEGVEWNGME